MTILGVARKNIHLLLCNYSCNWVSLCGCVASELCNVSNTQFRLDFHNFFLKFIVRDLKRTLFNPSLGNYLEMPNNLTASKYMGILIGIQANRQVPGVFFPTIN